MIATLMSGMFVIALLGRFWPRLNWQGALAAMLAAVITSLLLISQSQWLAYWGNPCLPAVACAMLAAIAVSLLTPRCRISRAEALKLISAQREEYQAVTEALPQESLPERQ
jgi:SSS family solute:Na+ symporter